MVELGVLEPSARGNSLPEKRTGLLVTGSHRSGSTWLGRILASADRLHYVQEPFNIAAHQRWLAPRPDRQFLYLDNENGAPYEEGIQRVLDLRYPLAAHLKTRPSPRKARRAVRITYDATVARRQGAQPLVKDPIALFSAPWLEDHFGLQPVILVRSPVAFVGSLKERKWDFDFAHWADQPRLLANAAARWREQINKAVESPLDIVDQGILQWNVMYDFVADLRARRTHTVVLSYEKLARDPAQEIPTLFDVLGLRFGPAQQAVLQTLTTSDSNQPASAIDVRRSSNASLDTWKSRLTADEVERVESGTQDVAERLTDL